MMKRMFAGFMIAALLAISTWLTPLWAQSLQSLPYSYLSTVGTNCTLVDGSGQNVLKWLLATNISTTTTYYLKIYNTKTTPVAGAGTPVIRIPLLPAVNGGGQVPIGFDDLRMTLGIGFCITGGQADTDTSNATSGISINLGYLWQ